MPVQDRGDVVRSGGTEGGVASGHFDDTEGGGVDARREEERIMTPRVGVASGHFDDTEGRDAWDAWGYVTK